MPIYGCHFEPGQLQFITTSTYHRLKLLNSWRFRSYYLNDSSVLTMDSLT